MDIKDNLAGRGIKPVQERVEEKDVYIHPALKRDLDGIIATVEHIEDYGTEMGDRNYILSGPPGTGKSLYVKYLATKTGCELYDGKMISSPQGVSSLFKSLREKAKTKHVMLVINELDKFSSRDDLVDPTQKLTLDQLLDEMDGTESNSNIFIFGTTNRPNSLDTALRRTKRFSKEIELLPPDRAGRRAILHIHADGKGGHKFHLSDADIEYAADTAFGYTGADLVGLLNEAFTNAELDKRHDVSREDLEYAFRKTKPSAIRDMPFQEARAKFGSIGGYETHKALLRSIVEHGNGTVMLFYGPKGTGKNLFAEALAGEYGFNYIVVSGSQPEDKFVGETGKILDRYLERAKQLAPCVLLFDEIDTLVETREIISYKSSWTGLLQSKLSKPIDGVYIIGAVNKPDKLNPPFLDRFIHKIYFPLPTQEEQKAVWKIYLPPEIDASELVAVNSNLSGRDIQRTQTMVKDFNLPPTLEVYKKLIEGKTAISDATYYANAQTGIGDSVRDFSSIMALGLNK
jgi:transitional endoplasmic reticulum ATPase